MAGSSPLRSLTFSISIGMMLGGIIFIFVGIYGVPAITTSPAPQQLVEEIGIAAVSAGMVGLIYDHVLRNYFLDQVKVQLTEILNADAVRLGVSRVYQNRSEKISDIGLSALFAMAKSEIMFVGLGLFTIVHDHGEQLGELARSRKVQFLVFDVNSPNAKLLERSLGEPRLIEHLKTHFEDVLAFVKEHAHTGNIEARLYDVVPTFGAIAVDRDRDDGCLLIELNCYGLPGAQCPGLRLQRKTRGLYDKYNDQVTRLWDANAASHLPGKQAGSSGAGSAD